MIPSTPVDDLARRIHLRRESPYPGPYILFLGDGCARAAGVPDLPRLARMALRLSNVEMNEGSDEEITARFREQIESMKPAHVARLLHRLFAATPVPTFYQYVAKLVRERFFPLILTTSYDTFLEQALANTGLRQTDYRVTTFGRHPISSSTGGDTTDVTHIVKLHGDIARDVVHLTPDQVERALNESKPFIKAELRGDLIMVGYTFDDEPINRWLTHSRDRELWWVAPEPPHDPAQFATWTNEPHLITGDEGRPPIFFAQLAPRLLQPGQYDDEEELPVVQGLESVAGKIADSLTTALQSEIRRAQDMLYSLEQEAPPELRPKSVQAQIAYQKRHASRLEEKMRTLPEVKPRLLELVSLIGASVQRAGRIERDVQQYLDAQIDTVRREMEKDQPNPFLVSASLGATLTLADRLSTEYGAEVVDPEHVRELAGFAPVVAAKVVF